ncbi:MAG: 50S ribosomal protein L5 [Thaumarchaeota archaeon]|jgi:large subunit ribosomal protein L5|nr:50S ribosomal protein L5 [Nitrososphaerota archaeon]
MMEQPKESNLMKRIYIDKVILHIGVGQAGEKLEKAKKVLQEIAGQEPSERRAKKTIRDFGIHRGEKIAVMVTLRKKKALEILQKVLAARGNSVPLSSVDEAGNLAFGIKEHIDIPGIKYNPEIGIFGLDVIVNLARPGYRVQRRKRCRSSIGKEHRITKEEAIEFYRSIGVNLV